jgi:hypothetical protein
MIGDPRIPLRGTVSALAKVRIRLLLVPGLEYRKKTAHPCPIFSPPGPRLHLGFPAGLLFHYGAESSGVGVRFISCLTRTILALDSSAV